MTTTTMPTTVALWRCPAEADSGRKILLSGLFDIVEHWGYEPSAGVRSPGFLVALPENREDPTAPMWWVEEADLMAQMDPDAHGRMLAQERELDFHEENEFSSFPHFPCPMKVSELQREIRDSYAHGWTPERQLAELDWIAGEDDGDGDPDKGHEFEPTGREQSATIPGVGPSIGVEHRCKHCGLIRWESA